MSLFLVAFVFAGFLEAALYGMPWSWLSAGAAVLFAGISFWRMSASISLSLLALAWAALAAYFLFLSQSATFAQLVIGVSTFFLYSLAYTFQAKRYTLGISLSFLIFLGMIFSLLRLQLLLDISLFEIVPLVFFLTSFLFFISQKLMLPIAELPLKTRLSVFSVGAGFFVSELYVIFSTFPFTIFAIDFMLFIVYYTLWDMTMRYFSRTFTKRSLAGNLAWFAFAFLLILLSVLLFHPSSV